ncbi:MAG: tryptophan-rich sensory protein [Actinomycetes bacterium]
MSPRQLLVLLSGAVALLGLAAGVGALGGPPVAGAAAGALATEASLVAPAGPAVAVWTPISAGLAAFAVWQAGGARRHDERVRRVDVPLAVSMVAGAGWVVAARAGVPWLTAVLIVMVLVSLVVAYGRLLADAPRGRWERVLLDGTTGLYLGWVSVATVAHVVALGEASPLAGAPPGRTAWSVLVVALTGVVAERVTWQGRGRLAFPAAVVWALGWVAVARTAGTTESTAVALAAVLAAVTVAGTAAVARRRR